MGSRVTRFLIRNLLDQRSYVKDQVIPPELSTEHSVFKARFTSEQLTSVGTKPQVWQLKLDERVKVSFVEMKYSRFPWSNAPDRDTLGKYLLVYLGAHVTCAADYIVPPSNPIGENDPMDQGHVLINETSVGVVWYICEYSLDPSISPQVKSEDVVMGFSFKNMNIALAELNLYAFPGECGDPERPLGTIIETSEIDGQHMVSYECDLEIYHARSWNLTCDHKNGQW